jgi:hypothetical protein
MPVLIDYYILLRNGFEIQDLSISDTEAAILRVFREHEPIEDPFVIYQVSKQKMRIDLYTVRRLCMMRDKLAGKTTPLDAKL